MMLAEFIDQVAEEIEGRTGSKLTAQQLDDWHHFCQPFAIDPARRHLQEFFRTHEGRFTPKPNEFGLWLKQQGRQAVGPSTGCFFDVEALIWPRASIAKFTLSDGTLRFGWIERHRKAEGNREAKDDIGNWWHRHSNGLFVIRAFTPYWAANHNITANLEGELFGAQRLDWLKGSNTRPDYPMGLDELLEGRAGALPGIY